MQRKFVNCTSKRVPIRLAFKSHRGALAVFLLPLSRKEVLLKKLVYAMVIRYSRYVCPHSDK